VILAFKEKKGTNIYFKMPQKTYIKAREFLRGFYYSHLKKFNSPAKDFPRIIQLETSTVCNGKCPMCPSQLIKRKTHMDEDLFKKIIKECKNTRLEEIHPFFFNEPFLFPKIFNWLRYVRKELPNVKISITTNGSLLTKEICDTIINENLTDKISFSLDACTPEMFKKARGLENFQDILKAINYLKRNGRIQIAVNFTIANYNLKELRKFKTFWKKRRVKYFINYDDGRKTRTPFINRRYKRPCKQPFDYFTILTTGEVVLCDMDALGKEILGNVKKTPIKEIWNNEKFRAIRKAHLIGKRNKIPLCRDCKITWT